MTTPLPFRLRWTAGTGVFLIGVASAAFTAFVLYHRQSAVQSSIDVNGFGLISRNLALGKGFSLGFGPTIRRAPLYPVLGALLLKAFGHATPGVPDAVAYRPIVIAQCLMFGLTCLVTWALARRLFGQSVALIAGLLCALLPQTVRYVGQTEVETLMGFLTVCIAYASIIFVEKPTVRAGAVLGLSIAAATLTKPIAQFYPIVFIPLAWWWWRSRSRHSSSPRRQPATYARSAGTAALIIFFLLPLVPWLVRNYVITGGHFLGISSNAPGEFLRGYILAEPRYYLLRSSEASWDSDANDYETQLLASHGLPFYHFNSPESGSFVVQPPIPPTVSLVRYEAQKDTVEETEALKRLAHSPGEALRKFIIQLATFWYFVDGRAKSLITGALAFAILACSTVGVLWARKQQAIIWPALALAVYFYMAYASTLALARYSMPLYPTLVVFAANGVAVLATWASRVRTASRVASPALHSEV